MKTNKKASKLVKVKNQPNPVTLTSYSIKAIIPTGPYANIQAEIVVNAGSLDDAKGYVIPHINTLFEEFLNKSERRNVQVTVKETPAKATQDPQDTSAGVLSKSQPKATVTATADVAGSIPFEKAKAAINSCLSQDALELIAKQIERSVKLNSMEKLDLGSVIVAKGKELEAKK